MRRTAFRGLWSRPKGPCLRMANRVGPTGATGARWISSSVAAPTAENLVDRVKMLQVDGPITRNPAAVKQKFGKDGEIPYHNPVAIPDRMARSIFCSAEYNRALTRDRMTTVGRSPSRRNHRRIRRVSAGICLASAGNRAGTRNPTEK